MAESESLEDVGVTDRRFFPAQIRLHLQDRIYAECPQLKAMAVHLGVDIAAIDSKDRFDQCSFYTTAQTAQVNTVYLAPVEAQVPTLLLSVGPKAYTVLYCLLSVNPAGPHLN